MLKLSPHEERKLLRATKGKKSISAKEYREALGTSSSPAKAKPKAHDFSFKVDIKRLTHNTYEVILLGKHLSVNSVNTLHFRQKLRYKNMVKKAFSDAGMIYKKILPKKAECAIFSPTVYNPKSRDDGANEATLKIVIDSLVALGFAVDDAKKYARTKKDDEVLSREWKISILVQMLNRAEFESVI